MSLMKVRLTQEAWKFLGDRDEADGAVNFIFAKLYRRAEGYNESRPATPYVISCLRNLCRDIISKRKRTIRTVSIDYKIVQPIAHNNLSGIDFELEKHFNSKTQEKLRRVLNDTYVGSKEGLYFEVKKEIAEPIPR
jgi:DNA-directed RNA polymerase specialized sigma24 family protein